MTFAKNTTQPILSVVVPLFQKVRHIVTALEDAFTSCRIAGAPFELVVVDDGSTDGSAVAAGAWADQDPDRRAALERSGGFPEGVTHGEDKVGWGRLALLGEVVWSPKVGAVWDKSADNRSDGSALPAPSPAFRDFLRQALRVEGVHEKCDICALA